MGSFMPMFNQPGETSAPQSAEVVVDPQILEILRPYAARELEKVQNGLHLVRTAHANVTAASEDTRVEPEYRQVDSDEMREMVAGAGRYQPYVVPQQAVPAESASTPVFTGGLLTEESVQAEQQKMVDQARQNVYQALNGTEGKPVNGSSELGLFEDEDIDGRLGYAKYDGSPATIEPEPVAPYVDAEQSFFQEVAGLEAPVALQKDQTPNPMPSTPAITTEYTMAGHQDPKTAQDNWSRKIQSMLPDDTVESGQNPATMQNGEVPQDDVVPDIGAMSSDQQLAYETELLRTLEEQSRRTLKGLQS